MKNVKLTKGQLIDLAKVSSCSEWIMGVRKYLDEAVFEKDDYLVNIDPTDIERVWKRGDSFQVTALKKVGIKRDTERNAFIATFDCTVIDDASVRLFGKRLLEVNVTHAGESNLIGRSLYIVNTHEVKLHNTPGGGTVIEILKK